MSNLVRNGPAFDKVDVVEWDDETVAIVKLEDEQYLKVYIYKSNIGEGELYHNHNFDGSGTSNEEIIAFKKKLDLEFCGSRKLTESERMLVDLAT